MATSLRFGLITEDDAALQAYQDIESSPTARASIILTTSAFMQREINSLASVRVAETVEQVCTDPETDAVFIALTVGAREDAARRALAAGKHVLVAGPWDAPLAEAQSLCALAKEKGVAFGISAPWAVNGAHLAARALVRAGLLGTLISWRDDLLRPQPMADTLRQALRPLALFSWLCGVDAEEVYAQQAPSAEGLDLVVMLVRYANGCLGMIQAGRGIPGGPGMHPQGMRLVGAVGQLDLTDAPMVYRTRSSEDAPSHSWQMVRHSGPRGDRALAIGQFAARVLAHQEPPLPASTALDPLRILEAAQRSLAENAPIPVSQLGETG